jgi:hypothetical protein
MGKTLRPRCKWIRESITQRIWKCNQYSCNLTHLFKCLHFWICLNLIQCYSVHSNISKTYFSIFQRKIKLISIWFENCAKTWQQLFAAFPYTITWICNIIHATLPKCSILEFALIFPCFIIQQRNTYFLYSISLHMFQLLLLKLDKMFDVFENGNRTWHSFYSL